MSDTQTATGLPPDSLPVEAQLEIDAACERFEQAWREGRQPQVEELVAGVRESIRDALRDELRVVEAQFSTRVGQAAEESNRAGDSETSDGTVHWTPSTTELPAAVTSPPGYELLEELGRGGMGVVYKARQTGLNRLVALKMIRSGELASREELERFHAEAQAAARLQHTNIVPVYEIGQHRGMPYFSMAFITGVSLKERIGEGPLKLREAAGLIKSVTEAVAYAHERGVVHRDLKPANILLNEAGEPCITDYGLAKRIDQGSDFTGTGQILGTPSYMPPEQAMGRVPDIGPQADVYALGATLYHLLTGRPPFQAASPIETIKQVIDTEAVPPRRLNAAVDRDLDTICMKCLEKGLARRYASARELADELGRYLNHEPIRARRIGPATRARRWCQRKPLAAALGVASVAAGFVGVLLIVRLLATQALAETHQFFSYVGKARQSGESAAPGWTRSSLADLETAARLRPASADPAELRSSAARAWGAWDVRRVSSGTELTTPQRVAAVAISPDGRRLALAEFRAGLRLSVGLHDTRSRSVAGTLGVNVAVDNLMKALRGSEDNVPGFRAVAFSPDGKWLVAGTRHGKIYCWSLQETASVDPLHSWQAHDEAILQLVFSPDSQCLYSSENNAAPLKRWLAPEWKPLPELPGRHRCFSVSGDGKWIVSGSGSIELFDAQSLMVMPAWNIDAGTVAFSGDSQLVVAGNGDELQMIEVASGKVVRQLRDPSVMDLQIDEHLTFTADDRLLISSCSDGRVRIWDVYSGALLAHAVAAGKQYPAAAVDRDGHHLAVTGSMGTALYEIVRPATEHLAAVGKLPIQALAFNPEDGTLAVVREETRSDGLVRRSTLEHWDLDADEMAFTTQVREHPGIQASLYEPLACDVAFHPRGTEAVWASSKASLRLRRNERLPQPAFTIEPGPLGGAVLDEDAFEPVDDVTRCEVRPDPAAANGKAMRLAPLGEVRVRLNKTELDTLRPAFACYAVVRVEGDHTNEEVFDHLGWVGGKRWNAKRILGSDVPSAAYHLYQVEHEPWPIDGERPTIDVQLRAKNPPGLTAIWIDRLLFVPIVAPWERGPPRVYPHLASQGPFSYSPEGDRLWGLVNNEIRCWTLADFIAPFRVPKLVTKLTHGDDALQAVAGNAETAVAVARRGDVLLHSAKDGRPLKTEFRPDTAISTAAVDPAGKTAVAGTEQGLFWILSVPELETLAELPAHTQAVTSLVFSRDGSLLVSGSQDRSVRLWGRSGKSFVELFRLDKLPGSVRSVRLSDDKRRLAVLLEQERGVRIWKLDELNDRFNQLRSRVEELPGR